MVKWKVEELRLAGMSLAVLAGGVLFVVGLANAILRARGEPAPTWTAIVLVTLLGVALAAWPLATAYREMRTRRAPQ